MAKLTTKERKKLPSKDFAVKGRKYPVPDASHARNALARVAQHGSSAEKAEVRAKVAKKFPGIGDDDKHRAEQHARGKKEIAAHHRKVKKVMSEK